MTETAYFSIITTKFGAPGLWTNGVEEGRPSRFALTLVSACVGDLGGKTVTTNGNPVYV